MAQNIVARNRMELLPCLRSTRAPGSLSASNRPKTTNAFPGILTEILAVDAVFMSETPLEDASEKLFMLVEHMRMTSIKRQTARASIMVAAPTINGNIISSSDEPTDERAAQQMIYADATHKYQTARDLGRH